MSAPSVMGPAPTHNSRSAKDRSASSCQSPTTRCRWSTATPGRSVCSARSSLSVAMFYIYRIVRSGNNRDQIALLEDLPRRDRDRGDLALDLGENRDFHLHGLE